MKSMIRKIKLRKSQVEMAQSVAVLFVFFLLIGFGIIVYAKFKQSSIRTNINEFEALKAVETAQIISYLNEIECSINSVTKDNCIDMIKLKHFITQREKDEPTRLYYQSIFGNSKVWVTEVYPGNRTWEVYSRPLAGNISQRQVHVPIIIYNPLSNHSNDFSFGVLNVEVYLEEKLA